MSASNRIYLNIGCGSLTQNGKIQHLELQGTGNMSLNLSYLMFFLKFL